MKKRVAVFFLLAALAAMPPALWAGVTEDANQAIKSQQLGDYDTALELYTRVLESGEVIPGDSLYGFVLNNRGVILFHRGEFDLAIADYDKSLASRPDPQVYVNRANAWAAKGDDDKAIADFSAALEQNPGYARAYHGRGYSWLNKGEAERAREDFAKAESLAPDMVWE